MSVHENAYSFRWIDRYNLARNENTSAETLSYLVNDINDGVLQAVAENFRTPTESLRMLYARCDSEPLLVWLKEYVRYNPNCPYDIAAMSGDEYASSNWHTPASRLTIYAYEQHNSLLQMNALRNPKTPVEVLVDMSNNDEPTVRYFVAANPSLPLKEIEKLARDDSDKVRAAIVKNPSVSDDILYSLISDRSPKVQRSLRENMDLPTWIRDMLNLVGNT